MLAPLEAPHLARPGPRQKGHPPRGVANARDGYAKDRPLVLVVAKYENVFWAFAILAKVSAAWIPRPCPR